VNLRGHAAGPPLRPIDALAGFLPALGVPAGQVPTDMDRAAALYRSLLADRRLLVVLDNARDADQVRPLLPGAPGCLVVVTSRNQLGGLVAIEGAHAVTLDVLTVDESRQLLAARLGADRVAREAGAVEEIIARCARLPLALAVVAARAATTPRLPLGTLAAELADGPSGLGALETGDASSDVRTVFSWSYPTPSPPAAPP